MSYPLVMRSLAEAVQDYVAANYLVVAGEPTLVAGGPGTNFTIGDSADIQDFERLVAGPTVLLTIFDEGGTLIPGARRTAQERSFRFAAKGGTAQEALDRAHDLLSWLWNKHTFATASYRVSVLRVPALPQIVIQAASGSHVADFVVTVLAYNRP
jgi:hypothetical protein